MEGNKKVRPTARAILVFGAPCSGKTTFGQKFAARFKSPFYDLDAIAAENNLTREHILVLIKEIAKTGKDLVIEGGLNTEKDRTEIRNIVRAAGYQPYLIWVQTDVLTIRARLKARHKSVSKAKAEYDARIAELEAPADFENPIILSGKHTFETQLRHALTGLA